MPASVQGLFSNIPTGLASVLETNKATLGLTRVTCGTLVDGLRVPEGYVSFPDDDEIRPELAPGEPMGRPVTRWLVPIAVTLLLQYSRPPPTGGTAPLTSAVLVAEKAAEIVLNNPGVGAARAVHFAGMSVDEGEGEAKVPTYGIVLRFVYEVVLSRV